MTDPRKCRAKSSQTGQPCKRWAVKGATVCPTHGGRAPQVRRAAAQRAATEKASALAEVLDAPPLGDPVAALLELGGGVIALVEALKSHVAALEVVSTGAGRYGETVKPEIDALLRAMREAERVLTSIVRLNLEERLVRIDEARADLVVTVIERVLADAGLDSQDQDVRASVARHLTLVAE
jgi:hypothetical protein